MSILLYEDRHPDDCWCEDCLRSWNEMAHIASLIWHVIPFILCMLLVFLCGAMFACCFLYTDSEMAANRDWAVSASLKNFLEMNSGGFQRYLGVIMFGQPIFEARLRDPRFQELAERIVMLPMPKFQTSARGYLEHRLKLVGTDADKLFDKEALDLICNQAQTPLQLGNIANEALRISRDAFNL